MLEIRAVQKYLLHLYSPVRTSVAPVVNALRENQHAGRRVLLAAASPTGLGWGWRVSVVPAFHSAACLICTHLEGLAVGRAPTLREPLGSLLGRQALLQRCSPNSPKHPLSVQEMFCVTREGLQNMRPCRAPIRVLQTTHPAATPGVGGLTQPS